MVLTVRNTKRLFYFRLGVTARRGQAMLIAVLALGGAILGATTIAGLLMTYQIKQTTDFENSAKAVFAADAGTQWALYYFFISSTTAMLPFNNGATTTVDCYDVTDALVGCGDPTAVRAIAKGTAGQASRALQATFMQ